MYTLTEAFAYIVQCLKDTIAPRRGMARNRMDFLSFLWLHLHTLNNRFAALYASWKNGTLPRPRTPPTPRILAAPGAPGPGRSRAARPAPAIRLPRGRLWLLKDTQAAAVAGSLLRHLIATNPELQEFMQAAPQVRSLLAPLCHALGIDIDRPYGVPPVKPTAKADAAPEPATGPASDPPVPAQGAPQDAGMAQNPPLVFSSA
jgi:hypothetical protein